MSNNSVNFLEEEINLTLPKPKYHLGQPVIINSLDKFNQTDCIITGMVLNYGPNSIPFWSYCIGDREKSYLDYHFEAAWYPESDLSSTLPKRQ